MPLWDKFRQGTRETFGGDRTNLPSDVLELVSYGEIMKRSYDGLITKTERFITPDFTKRLTDRFGSKKDYATKMPIYALGKAIREAGHDFEGFPVGQAYVQCGDVIMSLAEVEAEFEQRMHDGFLAPKQTFLRVDIKEGFEHYDKLKSRRLDYDAKKHKVRDASEEKSDKYNMEFAVCQAKLDESVGVVREYFTYLCDKDEQNGAQQAELMLLMQAMMDYHRESYEKLRALNEKLSFKDHMQHSAKARPAVQYNKSLVVTTSSAVGSPTSASAPSYSNSSPGYQSPTTVSSPQSPSGGPPYSPPNGAPSVASGVAMPPRRPPTPPRRLRCRALYPFTAMQSGDLDLAQGDVIDIVSQEHSDWWEGMVNGRRGIFPSNYVELLNN